MNDKPGEGRYGVSPNEGFVSLEEENRRITRMAEFEANQPTEQVHPDVDHSETATRHLDVEGTWMEAYSEATEKQREACKDLLKCINEQDKQQAIRRSMEANDRTKRIARKWKAERTHRRSLEATLDEAQSRLVYTEHLLGRALRDLSRVGLFRRTWRWLFGSGVDNSDDRTYFI